MSVIPRDQAAELRLLVAARQADAVPLKPDHPTARVLAVASGKGGVGKTNIAVNLAIVLARTGYRVLLVDADLGTANVDVVMNVQSTYDLSYVLSGQRTLDDVVVRIDERLRLIVGASGLTTAADLSPFDRRVLIDDLARFERRCDIIVIDCGAGLSQNVLAFAQAADDLLIVTTPEPTALTDAYALVKSISLGPRVPAMRVNHQPEAQARDISPTSPIMRLVVNQAGTVREAQRVAERIASVAARYLRVLLDCEAHIPADPHVPMAVRRRVPLVRKYPRSPAASAISALAKRIGPPATAPMARPAFFHRLLAFFH